MNVINNPTNICNIMSTSGVAYVNGDPEWIPGKNKFAINVNTGEVWIWERNKLGTNYGAWVVYGLVARMAVPGVPDYVPTNPAELAVDSLGTLYAWDVTNEQWITSSGGGSYTFTNGLTNTSGTVAFGGSLTEETTIMGDGNILTFTDLAEFTISDTPNFYFSPSPLSHGTSSFQAADSHTQMTFTSYDPINYSNVELVVGGDDIALVLANGLNNFRNSIQFYHPAGDPSMPIEIRHLVDTHYSGITFAGDSATKMSTELMAVNSTNTYESKIVLTPNQINEHVYRMLGQSNKYDRIVNAQESITTLYNTVTATAQQIYLTQNSASFTVGTLINVNDLSEGFDPESAYTLYHMRAENLQLFASFPSNSSTRLTTSPSVLSIESADYLNNIHTNVEIGNQSFSTIVLDEGNNANSQVIINATGTALNCLRLVGTSSETTLAINGSWARLVTPLTSAHNIIDPDDDGESNVIFYDEQISTGPHTLDLNIGSRNGQIVTIVFASATVEKLTIRFKNYTTQTNSTKILSLEDTSVSLIYYQGAVGTGWTIIK